MGGHWTGHEDKLKERIDLRPLFGPILLKFTQLSFWHVPRHRALEKN
jgi:hypothetical protein